MTEGQAKGWRQRHHAPQRKPESARRRPLPFFSTPAMHAPLQMSPPRCCDWSCSSSLRSSGRLFTSCRCLCADRRRAAATWLCGSGYKRAPARIYRVRIAGICREEPRPFGTWMLRTLARRPLALAAAMPAILSVLTGGASRQIHMACGMWHNRVLNAQSPDVCWAPLLLLLMVFGHHGSRAGRDTVSSKGGSTVASSGRARSASSGFHSDCGIGPLWLVCRNSLQHLRLLPYSSNFT